MIKYYKILKPNGVTPQGKGHYDTSYRGWQPKMRGHLVECRHGYHILRAKQILSWIGPELWEVEPDTVVRFSGDKCVCHTFRFVRKVEAWDSTSLRLLSCDYAEDVLPAFERAYPVNMGPRKAIETARLFAVGRATREELAAAQAAAYSAAQAAAQAAAYPAAHYASAAYSAAAAHSAAYSAAAAHSAAYSAAHYAARYAARYASAAYSAARKQQAARLIEVMGLEDDDAD